MRIVFAIVLVLHGFAHLVGFAGSWRLADNIPYKTTLLGGAVDVGDAGMRFAGVLWLVAALAFAAAGAAAFYRAPWWPTLTMIVILASLAMCVLALPETKIGLVLNVALLATLLIGERSLCR